MGSSRNCLVLLVALLSVSGCAGPSSQMRSTQSGPAGQVLPQQLAAQIDSQAKQNLIQAEFLKQAGQVQMKTSQDYRVGPEDLLEIRFLDAEKLNSEARVDSKGEIRLLLVGNVEVAGLTPTEAASKLARRYKEADYLRNPQITVSVKEYRHQRVAVTGAVNKPDHYALIGPRTLLEVLGMAGGLSDKAGESAHIIRAPQNSQVSQTAPQQSFSPGTETIVVDLNRLLLRGAAELNLPVQNGDVVHIPFAQTAYVLGSVSKPGGVLLKGNMTVTKAIAETGGLHTMLSSFNATILRMDENGQRQTLPVNLAQVTKGKAEDVLLRENDIVYVHESSARRFFFDLKMLLPGSFGMSIPGMM